MRGDGDGWSWSSDGSRHWGKHGAAGLLLRAPLAGGEPAVLLQHRAVWSHQGGTWALPGGARDSHETTVDAAIREAEEEAGIIAEMLRVRAERVTAKARSGWTYTTVIADAASTLATTRNLESTELRWVPETDVGKLRLHPGFKASWEALQARSMKLVLDDVAAAPELAEALPRTFELPDGGFGWLPGIERAEAEMTTAPTSLTAVISSDTARFAGVSNFLLAITPADVFY
jgi:8-oxo-dGTP diphosphatase